MAVKLSVGFQKKTGLPDYGSLGARCDVEFEIDSALLQSDLDGFHERARRAFSACQQAVNDQLSRQMTNGLAATNGHNGHAAPPANGYAKGGSSNGSSGSARRATQSQARAIRAIAGRQRLDLAVLLSTRFNVARPEELSIADASHLIDDLKGNGQGGRE